MQRVARVFWEGATGQYHYCSEELPYMDARGMGFATKRQALEGAYMAGFTHAVGSGAYRRGIRSILGQVPSAREFQEDHEIAQAIEEEYERAQTAEEDREW